MCFVQEEYMKSFYFIFKEYEMMKFLDQFWLLEFMLMI